MERGMREERRHATEALVVARIHAGGDVGKREVDGRIVVEHRPQIGNILFRRRFIQRHRDRTRLEHAQVHAVRRGGR